MTFSFSSLPDPYVLNDTLSVTKNIYRKTTGITPIQFVPNPAQKTLVLLIAGQSQWTNVNPTLYTPNSNVIQMNIYDGAFYPITDKMLGNSDEGGSYGPGNPAARVGDKFLSVNGGTFDKVVLVVMAIGGTSIFDWGPSGTLYDRPSVAMRRLSSLGITPNTIGVTIGFLWGQGETEVSLGTSQTTYQTALSSILSNLVASGFSGRKFICQETWSAGSTSAAVRAAQAAIVDNITIFSGGDLDTLNSTNRFAADNTHFNDTGAAAAATLVFNAMHASGAPY